VGAEPQFDQYVIRLAKELCSGKNQYDLIITFLTKEVDKIIITLST
jgi:hypothetical protein